jgi:riboflavin biosynthesis pyrimidine reductase
MRALLPEPADDVDVHAWYATDWLEPGGLRVNFVSSADGAATAGGLSKGLQTPGDNRVFAALRDLADVVLAGAGTARDENYRAVRLPERRQAIRREYGLPDHLPIAVISNALRLDPTAELFSPDAPARTIVITAEACDPEVRATLSGVADVIIAGDEAVDLHVARQALEARGLRRILCEGGPTLFGDMARTAVADELCLSISPLLAGPGPRRIIAGNLWTADPRELRLTALLEEDSALFARYRLD